MINTELFKQEWEKIRSLLDSIDPLFMEGRDSEGYEIDDSGITIKSSTYLSGCGTDTFSYTVKWDEMNCGIEYFQDKQKRAIAEDARLKEKWENDKKEHKKKEEIAMLKELQKKYGTGS